MIFIFTISGLKYDLLFLALRHIILLRTSFPMQFHEGVMVEIFSLCIHMKWIPVLTTACKMF